ncbi:MAG: YihY/virulence factor BrkB family protein [Acidobacteria bacterium]|nr:YihY/virulence factor BrkB family protein [Acidobacteriota bacterium]
MTAALTFAWLRRRELFGAVWRGAANDDIVNRSAELAYWFLLGFFPMLLSVTSMVAMLSSAPGSQGTLMKYLGDVLPSTATTLVRHVLAQTTGGGRAWFSLLFALWSSSSATAGLIDTLNAIYDVKESRPWWKSRLLALGLAVAMGVLLTAALIVVVYGPILLHKIAPHAGTPQIWRLVQWPTAALLLVSALLSVYRFAPNTQEQKWKWLLPGSIVAAAIWMVASVLFKIYIHHFSNFGMLYGSLGTIIILMFWFYLSGLSILLGGEINAVLEDAAAHNKVPGARRRDGRARVQNH